MLFLYILLLILLAYVLMMLLFFAGLLRLKEGGKKNPVPGLEQTQSSSSAIRGSRILSGNNSLNRDSNWQVSWEGAPLTDHWSLFLPW